MIQLRDYQADCLNRVRAALRRHHSVLLQAPTGSGKTAMGTVMVGNAVTKGLRVVWVNHRDFLIEQTSATFLRDGIFHSFVAAKRNFNPLAEVHVAMVQTLVNRLDRMPEPHLVIWDEGHHVAAGSWAAIFKAWHKARHVALTATPERLDGQGLGAFFGEIVPGPSVSWLIENGHLSDYRAFAPSQPSMAGIHSRAGDFVRQEISDLMDRGALIGDMVSHYKSHAHGLKAVYFCASIAHSKHVAEAFCAAGYRFMHLDAGSSTEERTAAAKALARGDLDGLCNVDLFGEGYDLAAQAGEEVSIDCIGLARPTQSLGLHLQQCGRGLRVSPFKKHCIILDHAGNLLRHGLPDQEREWSLDGRLKRKGSEDTGPPVRQCIQCFAVHSAALRQCPFCGFVYPAPEPPQVADGELEEVDLVAARKHRHMEEWACRTIGDLVELGRRRGYRHPEKWAGYIWTHHEQQRQARAEQRALAYARR